MDKTIFTILLLYKYVKKLTKVLTKFLVTGGAGYIGSHITQRLLKDGCEVKSVDKIPLEKAYRLKSVLGNPKFSYSEIDICNLDLLKSEFQGINTIVHLAASADIFLGTEDTFLDIKQGTILTYNILESMRLNNVKEIIFSSTGTVFGYPIKIPTSEDTGMMLPISLYGASKLASEGLISAYCNLFGMKSWIFRFGNIIGKDSKRGVIFDLITKLKKNSYELEVLGNGEQLKDYVYIDDCLEAIFYAHSKSKETVNVFHLGSDSNLAVKDIVKMILEEMTLKNVVIRYTGGPAGWRGGGWPGDINLVLYDISKLKKLGWTPKYSSREAVRLSIRETLKNYRDLI